MSGMKGKTMEHDICLNIHYSAPEEVWNQIGEVYRSMPFWKEDDRYPHWEGDGVELYPSVEPGGIQIEGTMPDAVWDEWYALLKKKLTEALGYPIGEPEEGFRFKFWKPFEKRYSEIKCFDRRVLVFLDDSTFYWEEFEKAERDRSAKPPCYVLKSEYIELRILFDETGVFARRKNEKAIHNFQTKLASVGIRTTERT